MDIIIIGAGGHGRVVLEILRAAGKYRAIGFLDSDPSLAGTEVAGLPVFGPVNQMGKLRHQKIKAAIVAIGDNRTRRSYARLLDDQGMELINAIHPSACISPSAKIGHNVVIAPGAIVTTEATIADSVILNTGCCVDHECEIGEAVHICPTAALAGRVRVGAGAFIGLGAKIIQCMSIGEDATIGAGAVVIRDVPAGATVVGVPARIIQAIAAVSEVAGAF
jgi:UDP-perosamine 4-acetyltransferase